MEIRADEISRIIREQIKDYGKKVEVTETGTVLSQADGVARIYGLAGADFHGFRVLQWLRCSRVQEKRLHCFRLFRRSSSWARREPS